MHFHVLSIFAKEVTFANVRSCDCLQLIFTKLCGFMGYCYRKNSSNCGTDATEDGRMVQPFWITSNNTYVNISKNRLQKSSFKSSNGRCYAPVSLLLFVYAFRC